LAAAAQIPIETVATVSAAGTARTLAGLTAATIHDVTLTSASCAFTLPTPSQGGSFTLILRQDATGGRLATWPGTAKWASGGPPTLSTTGAAIDVLSFFSPDGTNWFGGVVGYGFA
jgi:hypothetical protein